MAFIEITTNIGCKVNCSYCPQDKIIQAYQKRSKIKQMSLETFKTCLDKVPPEIIVCFAGFSEAWLNPDCTRMLLYAHERGHKIGTFTTLMGMNSRDIDLIEGIPFKNFYVHLPSENSESENIEINEHYLQVLNKISKSSIKAKYIVMGGKLHPRLRLPLKGKYVYNGFPLTRAGNVKIGNKISLPRKKGKRRCYWGLTCSVLLPNGEAVSCCMDYSMQHVLGNLLESNYQDLYENENFLKIKKGLQNNASDILCYHCENVINDETWKKPYISLLLLLNKIYSLRMLEKI